MAPEPTGGSLLASARRLPRILISMLLLCLVVQGTAVQSHVHFVEPASSLATAAGKSHVEAAPSGKGDSPADCPLCQEMAMAGAYVLPSIPVLPPPPAPVPWVTASAMIAFSLAAPSLGWLSRAPPE